MIIYKDIFTHKAVFTSAYEFTEVDSLYYIVEGEIVAESNAIDSELIGGTQSGSEDIVESENDVTLVADLIQACELEASVVIASKNDFKNAIQAYFRKLLEYVKSENPTEEEVLKTKAPNLIQGILENYERYSFYATEDDAYDQEGMIIPYEQEASLGEEKVGDSCKIIVFKHGVYQENV